MKTVGGIILLVFLSAAAQAQVNKAPMASGATICRYHGKNVQALALKAKANCPVAATSSTAKKVVIVGAAAAAAAAAALAAKKAAAKPVTK